MEECKQLGIKELIIRPRRNYNSRHFGNYHRLDRETHISRLEVTLLDSCQEEKDLKKTEDRWICNMGTLFGGGLNKRNEVLSHRRRNFGGS